MQRRYVTRDNGSQLLEKDLTDQIIAAAIEVHKALGPGLLESAYQLCMAHESKLRKLSFEQQVPLKVNYKSLALDGVYRLDFVYENRVVVELKTVEGVLPVHEAQLLTYLKLTGIRVGLLINFNVPLLKNGIYRRVL
jgi:GxxExxY protein